MISLPTYQPPKAAIVRPTAKKVNALQPREQTITVSGYGEVVPIVYGEAEVAGPLIAGPVVRNSKLYYAIALSHGPIEDVVKAYVGEDEFAISDAFSGAKALTKGGYTYSCTFYRGDETQGVSPLLAAHITDFADTFPGIAYAVIEASGTDAAFGGIHFKIKGRRVLDPRNSIVAYSENPALHLHDFVTNQRWGLGRSTIGIEALADECDKVLSYGPKAQVGHAILEPMEEASALELLAMYAEALFGFSGGDVRLVPDAEVPEGQITDIPASQIRAGTIRLSSQSSRNIPSSVTLNYNAKTVDGLAGAPAYISVAQTDASDPYMNSSLTLSGVYRQGEAERRAEQRLAQLRTPGRASFQMFDSGAYFSAGDVIRLPEMMGLEGEEFRLISQPEMIQAGLYQLHCEMYRSATYNRGSFGSKSIPKDAIAFRLDDMVPQGFERWGSAGDFIKGVSSGGQQRFGKGDFEVPIQTGYTSSDGAHSANKTLSLERVGGMDNGVRVPDQAKGSTAAKGVHRHSVTVGGDTIGNHNFDRTELFAVRCQQSTSSVPVGTAFLTEAPLNLSAIDKAVGLGLLQIANSSAGVEPGISDVGGVIFTTEAGAHSHASNVQEVLSVVGNANTQYPTYALRDDRRVGNHRHTVGVEIDAAYPDCVALNAYFTKTTEGIIPIGGVLGFVGSSAPDGWALCDGANGTLDLTDRFISLSPVSGSGDGSVTYRIASAVEASGAHTHRQWYGKSHGPDQRYVANADHGEEEGLHTHTLDSSFTLTFSTTPRYTTLRFIQYVGE